MPGCSSGSIATARAIRPSAIGRWSSPSKTSTPPGRVPPDSDSAPEPMAESTSEASRDVAARLGRPGEGKTSTGRELPLKARFMDGFQLASKDEDSDLRFHVVLDQTDASFFAPNDRHPRRR